MLLKSKDDSIFWDLDLGPKFLRQDSDSEMTLPLRACLRSTLLTKEVLKAGLSQDCVLSVTDPSQKPISEPFVRQVQVPIFAVKRTGFGLGTYSSLESRWLANFHRNVEAQSPV